MLVAACDGVGAVLCLCHDGSGRVGLSTSARCAEERQRVMRSRKLALALAGVLATAALLAGPGAAQAVFPNFSGCTITNPDNELCLDIQNRPGTTMRIKTFNIPLGESLEIRGKLRGEAGGGIVFEPPSGTNGFFARAVPVPGGLLGIEWLPGNSVLAITELAGSPSEIRVDIGSLRLRVPIKVRLVNFLLGMDCHIGTTRNPIRLDLITGTTSPPPPNTPISGRFGTVSENGRALLITGTVNVENSLAVPGATECGLGLGLINSLVNLKLGLPSAAGNNSVSIVNDSALGAP